MARVRWADIDEAAAAPLPAAQQAAAAEEDAWGPEDEPEAEDDVAAADQPARTVSTAQQTALAALLSAAHRQPLQPEPLQNRPKHLRPAVPTPYQQQPQQPQQQQQLRMYQVPSLHKLCLTVLGQHVTAVVDQLAEQVQWLPADVRAALLAVARRRGELTAFLLSSLADDSWQQLDLAGCSKLYGAELLAAAAKVPKLTALDVTGCGRISAGGWRQLAQAWPHLQVIRLGGSAECSEAALKALPHILPGVPPPPHRAAAAAPSGKPAAAAAAAPASGAAAAAGVVPDSWEDAFASDSDDDDQEAAAVQAVPTHGSIRSRSPAGCAPGSSSSSSEREVLDARQCSASGGGTSSSSVGGGRLKQLQALIWPDVPSAAVELVQQRCPRVLVNPPLQPDRLTGELPPREWDPLQPLDGPRMEMVLPEALQTASEEAVAAMAAAQGKQQQQQEPVVHIADKFRQAYIDRAKRLQDKERRLAAAEQKKQLKASHALRTLHAWLDEQD